MAQAVGVCGTRQVMLDQLGITKRRKLRGVSVDAQNLPFPHWAMTRTQSCSQQQLPCQHEHVSSSARHCQPSTQSLESPGALVEHCGGEGVGRRDLAA